MKLIKVCLVILLILVIFTCMRNTIEGFNSAADVYYLNDESNESLANSRNDLGCDGPYQPTLVSELPDTVQPLLNDVDSGVVCYSDDTQSDDSLSDKPKTILEMRTIVIPDEDDISNYSCENGIVAQIPDASIFDELSDDKREGYACLISRGNINDIQSWSNMYSPSIIPPDATAGLAFYSDIPDTMREPSCIKTEENDDLDVCGRYPKPQCGAGSLGDFVSQTQCKWLDCNDIKSYTGKIDAEYFQHWIDECLQQTPMGDTEGRLSDAENHIQYWNDVSILGTRVDMDQEGVDMDFLAALGLIDLSQDKYLGAQTWDEVEPLLRDIEQRIKMANNIPTNFKGILLNKVKQCSNGWLENEDTKRAYVNAGGRPLIGYNSQEGLVCKNSLYKNHELVSNTSKLVFNSDICPEEQCPCDVPTICEWDTILDEKSFIGKNVDILYNSVGGNDSWCRIPDCRRKHPGKCLLSNIGHGIDSMAETIYNYTPSFGRDKVGSCGN